MQTHRSKAQIALTVATLTFAANFSIWVLYAVVGIQLKDDLSLNATEFGLLLAAPMLTGAIFRLPVGLILERYSPKRVFLLQMACTLPPLVLLKMATTYADYLIFGALIGISGVSFTIGIRYIVDWFESKYQGTAMGIFGAGNAGAAITLVIAPIIIDNMGLSMIGPLYAGGLLFVILLFAFIAPDTPKYIESTSDKSWQKLLSPLAELKVWRFGLYYFFVFGSFLALTLWLPQYYVAAFGLNLSQAMALTLLFVASSSLVRAAGGWFADKYGASKVSWSVFWVCLVCLFFLSYPPTTMVIQGVNKDVHLTIEVNVWIFTILILIIGIAQGFGRASIYKIIYQHYPKQMGTVGGAVSMVGAMGGCTLPILFGLTVDFIGVYTACFMLLYGVLAVCMLLMYYAHKQEQYKKRLSHAIKTNFLDRE